MKSARLDVNGGDSKPYPQEENFVRDDWGGQVLTNSTNPSQANIRQDVNGSSDKPYPQERNFVIHSDPSIGNFEGEVVTQTEQGNVTNVFGQVKYARREGDISIYKDASRATANDAEASARAEGSCVGEDSDEGEKTGETY